MPNNKLHIGVIQTSLEAEAAWVPSPVWQDVIRMSHLEEMRAKREIRHYLASLRGLHPRADIILLPELSVPIGYVQKLKHAAEKMESIIIAGELAS